MKIRNRNSEKGFALALALMMLVVMSVMGATLMSVVSNDHKSNGLKDTNQQTFYAAETGIKEAKRYMLAESNLTVGNTPKVKFCKPGLFPSLGSAKAINDHVESKNLDELINASTDETKRLANYSYEYFITYTPDASGNTSTPEHDASATGNTGGDISESSSYKAGTTGTKRYYTIYSCGCDASKNQCQTGNIVTALESYVTKVN